MIDMKHIKAHAHSSCGVDYNEDMGITKDIQPNTVYCRRCIWYARQRIISSAVCQVNPETIMGFATTLLVDQNYDIDYLITQKKCRIWAGGLLTSPSEIRKVRINSAEYFIIIVALLRRYFHRSNNLAECLLSVSNAHHRFWQTLKSDISLSGLQSRGDTS